jgi:hypothetical protein
MFSSNIVRASAAAGRKPVNGTSFLFAIKMRAQARTHLEAIEPGGVRVRIAQPMR